MLCLIKTVIGTKKATISQYFLLKFIFAEKNNRNNICYIIKEYQLELKRPRQLINTKNING